MQQFVCSVRKFVCIYEFVTPLTRYIFPQLTFCYRPLTSDSFLFYQGYWRALNSKERWHSCGLEVKAWSFPYTDWTCMFSQPHIFTDLSSAWKYSPVTVHFFCCILAWLWFYCLFGFCISRMIPYPLLSICMVNYGMDKWTSSYFIVWCYIRLSLEPDILVCFLFVVLPLTSFVDW
jgi:hypothetical protein